MLSQPRSPSARVKARECAPEPYPASVPSSGNVSGGCARRNARTSSAKACSASESPKSMRGRAQEGSILVSARLACGCTSPILTPPRQLREGARDPHDLIELEYPGADDRDEEIAGEAGGAGLGGIRDADQPPPRRAGREAGQAQPGAVGADAQDLLRLAVRHEDRAAPAPRQDLRHRALQPEPPLF